MLRLITVWVLWLASASASWAGDAAAVTRSLCRSDEQIIFNCAVAKGSKLVSLCGSKSLDNRRGYLQYRFGAPGAIELQFPSARANTQLAFRYAHYFRAQVDRSEITFDNGDYRYTLFDYYEGDVKPVIKASGIRVKRLAAGDRDIELKCAGTPAHHLGTLESVIARDPDNPLNQ